MIVLVQPFGMLAPCGGPRILRALTAAAHGPWRSICTSPERPPALPAGTEAHLPMRPLLGRVEATRLRRSLGALGLPFSGRLERRMADLCREWGATALHAVAHDWDFWPAYRVARRLAIPYYLTVHDDLEYVLRGRPERALALRWLARAWGEADGRMVICPEMGEEYCRRYGRRPYTVVTDGLEQFAAAPLPRPANSLRVYFAGALHWSYRANFQALLRAMQGLFGDERAVGLTCRGGTLPAEEEQAPVRSLPWAPESEVARDLEDADLLYFPLPFGPEHANFVRYSLSTKMVTYLGSGLPILYHGPADAAAARLLSSHDAAILLDTLEPSQIAIQLRLAGSARERTVRNALSLGQSHFRLADQQQQFWSMVRGAECAVRGGDGGSSHAKRPAIAFTAHRAPRTAHGERSEP